MKLDEMTIEPIETNKYLNPQVRRARAFYQNALNVPEIRLTSRFLSRNIHNWNNQTHPNNEFAQGILDQAITIGEGEDPRQYTFATIMWMKGYNAETTSKVIDKDKAWVESFWGKAKLRDITQKVPISSYDNIESTLDEVVKNNIVRIGMGTTPSGDIHLANMYTLLGSAYAISAKAKDKNIKSVLKLGINNMTLEPEQYKKADHCIALIRKALADFNEKSGVHIDLMLYSELQQTKKFRKNLEIYRRNSILGRNVRLLSSIKGENNFRELSRHEIAEMDLNDRSIDLSSDLTGTIALKVYASRPDIYVLGGDFGHGNNPLGRQRYPSDFSRPRVFSPGILYGLDGEEMHVSSGNSISYEEIKEENWFDIIEQIGRAQRNLVGPLDYFELLSKEHKENIYSKGYADPVDPSDPLDGLLDFL